MSSIPDRSFFSQTVKIAKTDVTKLLKSATVPVYIDRMNENIGFVDVDAVLPEIRIHY